MRYAIAGLAALLGSCASPPPAATKAEKKAPVYFTADPATAGNVTGQVRWSPAKAAAKAISMASEEACAKLHPERVFDDPDRFALVYLKSGLEGKAFAPAESTVLIDQKGCLFTPRVLAVRTGQTIAVRNSDPVSHSIHPLPKNNREWNQQQAPGAENLERRFARPEILIPVKCNIHAWMKAYIAVLDHPFFAVVERGGTFQFKGLPPGDYTLAAWHERHGEKTQTLKIETKATASAAFVFP